MDKEKLIIQIEQGLSTWQIAKLNNTNQTNIRNILKRLGLKTKRKSNNELGVKTCPKCKITKQLNEFYQSSKSSSFCKKCILETNKNNRQKTKRIAIDYKGGKCINCGYNKCDAALEFHHINPEEKDKDYFNQKTGFTESLKKELDKCILLCANCHRELHSSLKHYHAN